MLGCQAHLAPDPAATGHTILAVVGRVVVDHLQELLAAVKFQVSAIRSIVLGLMDVTCHPPVPGSAFGSRIRGSAKPTQEFDRPWPH